MLSMLFARARASREGGDDPSRKAANLMEQALQELDRIDGATEAKARLQAAIDGLRTVPNQENRPNSQ